MVAPPGAPLPPPAIVIEAVLDVTVAETPAPKKLKYVAVPWVTLSSAIVIALLPPGAQDADIANYAYIWFNKSKPLETIIQAEKNFIHETITKGTFPTYFKTYTNEETEVTAS